MKIYRNEWRLFARILFSFFFLKFQPENSGGMTTDSSLTMNLNGLRRKGSIFDYRCGFLITTVTVCLLTVSFPTAGNPLDAVGSSDFYRLVTEDGVFVDRSLFIHEYFRRWKSKNIIVRPRYFGKSVNMDMLKRFMEIEMDTDGNILPESARKNRVLFTGGNVTVDTYDANNAVNGTKNVTLAPLEIANQTMVLEKQGQIPVLYLTLKPLTGLTFDAFENLTRHHVADLFAVQYAYVRQNLTDAEEIEMFDNYARANVSVVELVGALDFLTRRMQRYFDNRKVHLLVDDYDTPLRNILNDALDRVERRFNETDEQLLFDTVNHQNFHQTVRLIAQLLGNALENNPSVDQALINGFLPLAKTDMAPELKDVREYSVMNKPFSQYYGFFEKDVGQLAGKLAVKSKRQQMKLWYKGYNFAANVLYNPYSTMSCLRQGGLCSDYWIRDAGSRDTRFVNHLMVGGSHHAQLCSLFDGESIEMDVKNSKFSYMELVTGDLLRYLLFTGYLTPLWRKSKKTPVKLKVPNYEVKTAFGSSLVSWARRKYGLNANQTEHAVKLLKNENIHEFQSWLRNNF